MLLHRPLLWIQLRDSGVTRSQTDALHAIPTLRRPRIAADTLSSPTSRLDPIPTLNHIRLQADRARFAVQFEEKSASITEDAAVLVAAP